MNLRSRILYGMRAVLLLIGLIALKGLAVAEAQSLTPGSVGLSSTFEAISVRAQFSGDSSANATATIKFRKSGEVVWRDAYPPIIDRRTTIGGAANPYAFEARGSIVGLTSSTAYEVQVTWADPDGVSGAQPGVATVTTLSYTPPTGGSTITVTDDATLASALSSVNPGQTIHLNVGTYNAFAIGRSGNSGAWITIEGATGGGSIISGANVAQNILVNANFLIIRNLTLSASDSSGVVLSGGVHHVFVQDNVLQNISAQCAANPNGHYGDGGITIGNNANNVFVLRNTVNSTALNSPACTLNPIWDSPGAGIQWANVTTLVVKDNIVTGGFRDAITLDSSTLTAENVDLTGNTVSGYKDDGIESKGGNVNVRLSNNRITADAADTCIAGNTNSPAPPYGPLYIFRNICRVTSTNPNGTTTFKITPGAPMYLFHNSIDSSLALPRWDNYVMSGGPFVVLNNISVSSGSMIDNGSSTSTFDYNLGIVTAGAAYAYRWNGTATYDTFAAFRAATGQEAHGLNSAPLFLDTALRIGATSPALDKGVILPNFNTLDSAWPYSGSAPDIGAFELPAAQTPSTPINVRIQ